MEPNTSEKEHRTEGVFFLYGAVVARATNLIKSFLEAGADPNVCDETGHSALHVAVEYGDLEIMKLLLDAGADPDKQKDDGWTPLHIATHDGHAPSVKALLDAGANPSIAEPYGRTPIDYAENHPRLRDKPICAELRRVASERSLAA